MGRRSSPCGVRRGARLSAVLSRKIGEGNPRSVTWPRKHVGRDARVVAKSCTAQARSCSRTLNLHALCGNLLFASHVPRAGLWTVCSFTPRARHERSLGPLSSATRCVFLCRVLHARRSNFGLEMVAPSHLDMTVVRNASAVCYLWLSSLERFRCR